MSDERRVERRLVRRVRHDAGAHGAAARVDDVERAVGLVSLADAAPSDDGAAREHGVRGGAHLQGGGRGGMTT